MVRKIPNFHMMESIEKKEYFRGACPCCGLNPEAEPFSMCCDPVDLGMHGPGYVSFFVLLKFCIVLSIIFSVINIPKLIRNLNGTNCVPTNNAMITFNIRQLGPCKQDWITVHSISNYGTEYLDWLDRSAMCVFLLIQLIVISIFSAYLDSLSNKMKAQIEDPKEWTLKVDSINFKIENINREWTESKIIKTFEQNHQDIGAKVLKINSSYKLESYLQAVKEFETIKVKVSVSVPLEKNRIVKVISKIKLNESSHVASIIKTLKEVCESPIDRFANEMEVPKESVLSKRIINDTDLPLQVNKVHNIKKFMTVDVGLNRKDDKKRSLGHEAKEREIQAKKSEDEIQGDQSPSQRTINGLKHQGLPIKNLKSNVSISVDEKLFSDEFRLLVKELQESKKKVR